MVAPGTIATATEDKKLDLTCSSIGGSPDPSITWYREGSAIPLPAPVNRGGSKDRQTTSTLSITPQREDDGAKYRCVVWNRAMPEGQRLETTVTLNVNWANIGYLDNSYSNSNNGGSVNSQDSIWQMKMSAAAGAPANLMPQHTYVDQQASYGYDPLAHAGYGAIDDYAPYPHLAATHSQHGGDDYQTMRNSQNPSRQEVYCSDPYAAVHKPKKRLDHLDSPYHDVSGLPESYMEQVNVDDPNAQQQQHLSHSYDDGLQESGYSTPNSRNRRVIREIIV